MLVFLIFLSSCAQAKELIQLPPGQTLDIVVVTDLHYLDPSLFDQGSMFKRYVAGSDGRMIEYNADVISAFVSEMIKRAPDILIISGDLTNNGEKVGHLALAEKLKSIEEVGTRVYVIPGNHDLLNAYARSFLGANQTLVDTVTVKEFSDIYADFGYEEAVLKDETSLSYLAMPSSELWLLMLDTNKYSNSGVLKAPYSAGALKESTLDWIQEVVLLAEENQVQIITVMHHNLLNHNPIFNDYVIDNSADVIPLFHTLKLSLVLSGHLHIQDIKQHKQEDHVLYDIATSSLLMSPFQYGVIKYIPNRSIEYTSAQVNVEAWAQENHLNSYNLLNFKTYSNDFFLEKSYLKSYERLYDDGGFTEEEMTEMAKVFSLLNTQYFAGNVDSIKDELSQMPGMKSWLRATEPEFLVKYIKSMIQENQQDPNHLFIED